MVRIPRLLQWLLAPTVTFVLFVVAYNNSYRGAAILVGLLALNLGWAAMSTGRRVRRVLGESGVPACLVSGLLIGLGLWECLFPWVAPRDFAAIKELSTPFMGREQDELTKYPVVYRNTDHQGSTQSFCVASLTGKAQSWHRPGLDMAYFGYDPNEKSNYINVVRWNSMGYHDRDYAFEKQPGVYRIVVIGDSFVESVQVPLSRTFHKLLEKKLNSGGSGDSRRHEVIALGSSGTGQVDNLGILRSQGLKYDPDLVLMTLSSNDFCDDDPELKKARDLFSGQMSRSCRGLVRHGYLGLAFALRRTEELRKNRISVSPEILQWSAESLPSVEKAWQRTLDCVRQSRDECIMNGVEFALVYLSSEIEVRHAIDPTETIASLRAMGGRHREIPWDLMRSIRRTKDYCTERGIRLISLLEPLAHAQKHSGRMVFGDHFSAFGHQTIATAIGPALNCGSQDLAVEPVLASSPVYRYGVGAIPTPVQGFPISRTEAMKVGRPLGTAVK